jgi:hypothetical protein
MAGVASNKPNKHVDAKRLIIWGKADSTLYHGAKNRIGQY